MCNIFKLNKLFENITHLVSCYSYVHIYIHTYLHSLYILNTQSFREISVCKIKINSHKFLIQIFHSRLFYII